VIALLRFIGVMNAAVWLGAAVFFVVGASPAISSTETQSLLGQKFFPYFSGAILQIVQTRYFHLHLACSVVAVLHFLGEYLYLGRRVEKFSVALLIGLLTLSVLGGSWLQPKLQKLHATRYLADARVTPEERQNAAKAFNFWRGVSQLLNFMMIGGLVVYVWSVANPSDAPRFVSAGKFRG
jgi:Domain of unknown function (DUF4149)